MAYSNPDPSKLTEFAPLSSDMKPTGSLWSRFFKRSTPDSGQETKTSDAQAVLHQEDRGSTRSSTASLDSVNSAKDENQEVTSLTSSSNSASSVSMATQPRTLSSVLKRLSNILDRRSQTPQAYKDSDFKQYWMPDSNCRECYECGDRFNTFRRRHHCRICGQIFCSRCCNQEVPGKIMGYTGSLRVCTYCCKVVLSYAQNPDTSSADLGCLSEDLKSTLSSPDSDPSLMTSLGQGRESSWMGSISGKASRADKVLSLFEEDSSSLQDGVNMASQPLTPFDVSMETESSTIESLQRERQVLLHDSVELRGLWQLMQEPERGVEVQTHRHRLRTYTNCMVGSDIVQWLVDNDHAVSRDQAIVLGQALVEANWLECVSSTAQLFRDDYAFYRPGEMASQGTAAPTSEEDDSSLADDSEAPLWFREIEDNSDWVSHSELEKIPSTITAPRHLGAQSPSVFIRDPVMASLATAADENLQVNVTTDGATNEDAGLCRPDLSGIRGPAQGSAISPRHLSRQDSVAFLSDDLMKGVFTPNGNDMGDSAMTDFRVSDMEAQQKLRLAQEDHMKQFTNQLLCQFGLSQKWADIVTSLANKVSSIVQPNVRDKMDSMDIRKYIQIKKISSASSYKSTIIWGVVCSKNIAHKKMKAHINEPKILLLRAPIEYQRVEQKFSSLEPQILQEHEHLKKCVARIVELRPDLLLVEKTVSRLAQDFLLHAGITLVTNVKSSVMERISRMTQADIVLSIDSLVSRTSLGTCQSFYSHSFTLTNNSVKTLLYFDGCQAELGCTILLHAPSHTELKKVKAVTDFLVYMSYNAKLELPFLVEEYASAPDAESAEFFLSSDSSQESSDADIKTADVAIDNFSEELSATMTTKNFDNSNACRLDVCQKSELLQTCPAGDLQRDVLSGSADDLDGAMMSKSSVRSHEQRATEVLDHSDPLHNYLHSQDETIFSHQGHLTEEVKHSSHVFKSALNDVLLSVSPFVKFNVPYLETYKGSACEMRSFFPHTLYYSSKFNKSERSLSTEGPVADKGDSVHDESRMSQKHSENDRLLPPHAFVKAKLTSPVTSQEVQAMLADFRARGGTIKQSSVDELKESSVKSDNYISCETPYNTKDCLDPKNHQRIAVLFSSFSNVSVNTPRPCVYPWVVNMDFYGKNDMTLGLFLERYCFRDSYKCPSKPCETTMVDHIRRFVHDKGCLQVMLKQVEEVIPGGQNNILMWSWCRRCKQVTPVVTMSLSTWNLSFAKYLELRFHGNGYVCRGDCRHSLHHDHYQYFGCKQVVASFRYSPICLREISLPPLVLQYTPSQVNLSELHQQAETLLTKLGEMLNSALEHLNRLKQTSDVIPLTDTVQKEFATYRKEIEDLSVTAKLLMTAPNTDSQEILALHESLIVTKHELAESVSIWSNKLQELDQLQKKQERTWSLQHSSSTSRLTINSHHSESKLEGMSVSSSAGQNAGSADAEPTFVTSDVTEEVQEMTGNRSSTTANQATTSSVPIATKWGSTESTPSTMENSPDSRTGSPCRGSQKMGSHDDLDRVTSGGHQKGHQRSWSYGESKKIIKQEPAGHEPEKKTGVKNLLSSFLSSTGPNPIPSPFPPEEHHGLKPSSSVPVIVYDTEPSSIIAYTLSSADYEEQLKKLNEEASTNEQTCPQPSSISSTPETSRKTSTRVLSFMRGKEKAVIKAESNKDGNFDIDAVKYTPNLDKESLEESVMSTGSCESEMSSQATDSQMAKNTKIVRDPVLNAHIEIQFSDSSHKFYCRVYFAEEFRKLRQLIFPFGEKVYVRSLSRCFTWLATGGKSGSSFCKTQEDRFILKQMSRMEVQSFTDFAPHYFEHLGRAHQHKNIVGVLKGETQQVSCWEDKETHDKFWCLQRPTALAKILGVYRIGYQSNQTTTARKQDLLVMENLFYNRNITQIFDLKGSMRNRLVSTSGKRMEDLVLLDENLLKLTLDSPLYIGQHSKAVLYAAIMADTDFLANHLVMDYSLLVGLDEDRKQLVVGIIDYIRTFTWDKKIEMVVKQLGGQGKMPTVVSPNLYKTRFREAMTRYFLPVPDTWSGLGLAETLS